MLYGRRPSRSAAFCSGTMKPPAQATYSSDSDAGWPLHDGDGVVACGDGERLFHIISIVAVRPLRLWFPFLLTRIQAMHHKNLGHAVDRVQQCFIVGTNTAGTSSVMQAAEQASHVVAFSTKRFIPHTLRCRHQHGRCWQRWQPCVSPRVHNRPSRGLKHNRMRRR